MNLSHEEILARFTDYYPHSVAIGRSQYLLLTQESKKAGEVYRFETRSKETAHWFSKNSRYVTEHIQHDGVVIHNLLRLHQYEQSNQ